MTHSTSNTPGIRLLRWLVLWCGAIAAGCHGDQPLLVGTTQTGEQVAGTGVTVSQPTGTAHEDAGVAPIATRTPDRAGRASAVPNAPGPDAGAGFVAADSGAADASSGASGGSGGSGTGTAADSGARLAPRLTPDAGHLIEREPDEDSDSDDAGAPALTPAERAELARCATEFASCVLRSPLDVGRCLEQFTGCDAVFGDAGPEAACAAHLADCVLRDPLDYARCTADVTRCLATTDEPD